MLEVGRVCLKTAGREAGKYCVIVKKVDANFVMVTGPREITTVKRRKCSVSHLEPLMEKVKIAEDAGDDHVFKAWEEAGLFEKLGVAKPTQEQIAEARKRREERSSKRLEEEKKAKEIKEKLEKARAEKKSAKTAKKAEKPAGEKKLEKETKEAGEAEKKKEERHQKAEVIPEAGISKEEIEKEVEEELRHIDEEIEAEASKHTEKSGLDKPDKAGGHAEKPKRAARKKAAE